LAHAVRNDVLNSNNGDCALSVDVNQTNSRTICIAIEQGFRDHFYAEPECRMDPTSRGDAWAAGAHKTETFEFFLKHVLSGNGDIEIAGRDRACSV